MYEDFFGFNRKPFSKTPDPDFLYLSRTHEEALARLLYAVEEKEIVLLTGEVGAGKTTITRALMDSLNDSYRIILILNPRLTPLQFIMTIAKRMGVERVPHLRSELNEMITDRIYSDHTHGITPVIIIDEAQLITDKRVFEELRLLSNFQLDDRNLLSIILVAQSDLKNKLRKKVYMPLRQRIGMYYHIGPLEENEVEGYIKHRLKVAGCDEDIFTPDAISMINKYSKGIPRIINNIANIALLEAMSRDTRIIDESIINYAVKELDLDGYSKD